MNEIFKRRNYYSRKSSRCILESKGYYSILVASPFGDEVHFVVILLCDAKLMIAIESIIKLIHFFSSDTFKSLICKWCWEWIM